jgi:hypothetical protein
MAAFGRRSLRPHQPVYWHLIRFQLSPVWRVYTNLLVIAVLCCTCVLCLFSRHLSSPLWPPVMAGMRPENSLSANRYVASQQKPAIQDDEVGHQSGLPTPLRGVMVSMGRGAHVYSRQSGDHSPFVFFPLIPFYLQSVLVNLSNCVNNV